jgi:uncharacterized protein (TIGR02444 family)
MTALSLSGPHWSFALQLYRQPGVSDACLALQDRLGVDVNILLFALFAAIERGIALNDRDVQDMDETVAAWRSEIVLALRALRRRMKNGPEPAPNEVTEALREQIKRAELAAEQVEQAMLARWLDQRPSQPAPQGVDIAGAIACVVSYFAGRNACVPVAGGFDARDCARVLLQAAAEMDTDIGAPTRRTSEPHR